MTSGGSESSVVVAPREIKDLVDRCCRVSGCTAGSAQRLALNVLHGEIHHGDAISTFLAALAAGPSEVGRLARAYEQVELAEVAARSQGAASAAFDRPVPLAAISQAVADARTRGVESASVAATMSAGTEIDAIEFVTATLGVASPEATARSSAAHRDGLTIPEDALRRLEAGARPFLVAEETLDSIAG